MSAFNSRSSAIVLCLALSNLATAQALSPQDYESRKSQSATEYQTAAQRCNSLSGNSKEICMTEARSAEKNSRAELESSYRPTDKNIHQARITKAEGIYAVARQHCHEVKGSARSTCMKDAKAVEKKAKKDALAEMKSMDASKAAPTNMKNETYEKDIQK
ncbi:hypothetical protein [Uliginosibacterium sp. H1]|uniref:hypothetical protein n=1 Tax=Uliginosibacterium sp. H1 TaxID=3114757 RepID=UPI002E184E9F|nr:hypothetical protein [Uliginosibacterium sp. H1]